MKHTNIIEVAKIPIIGEIIIAVGIYLTLGAMAASLDYFSLEEQGRITLFRVFAGISFAYIILSLCIRIFIKFKKTKRH